jgi:hypothetical protein
MPRIFLLIDALVLLNDILLICKDTSGQFRFIAFDQLHARQAYSCHLDQKVFGLIDTQKIKEKLPFRITAFVDYVRRAES